jgi:8-oxo-dGTP diphosphatase
VTDSAEYDPSGYPPFAVTADAIVFTISQGQLHVALVERGNDPYKGRWALPGGFVEPDEDLAGAAARELAEETGIELSAASMRQLGAYGAPNRDPRMRVVSVAFWTIQPALTKLVGGSDAATARLMPVKEVLSRPEDLAFDHHQILSDAVQTAKAAMEASA